MQSSSSALPRLQQHVPQLVHVLTMQRRLEGSDRRVPKSQHGYVSHVGFL